MSRLLSGGRIDRTRPLRFTFDGKVYSGFAGDTLASALLANDVQVVGRSFKYHRPRGMVGAWVEEPNAMISLGPQGAAEPNVRTTTLELFEGLTARSQNAWPGPGFDVFGLLDLAHRLLPSGFYYKTFMWPAWRLFEPSIRQMAGAAQAPERPDDARYVHRNAHCDVLVVGAGPAGLAAALSAGSSGARVILVEDRPDLGGSLAWRGGEIDLMSAKDFVTWTTDILRAMPEVRILTRTQMFGAYDHGFVAMAERISEHEGSVPNSSQPRQRLWRVRAKHIILATGAIERPLLFPDNDRPGVMLASAAREYVHRYAVLPAKRPVLFTNNNDGYVSALDLADAGVRIGAVIDIRKNVPSEWRGRLAAAGIPLHAGCAVSGVYGSPLSGAAVSDLATGRAFAIDCDGVLVAGGWTPTVHLHSQRGGKLAFDERLSCFRPIVTNSSSPVVGGANGEFGLDAALKAGWAAGAAAAHALQAMVPARSAPIAGGDLSSDLDIEPYWRLPASLAKGRRQWVDFQNDVTTKDLALAAREGYRSVEHLKRYTTTGMATDQGKTSNVNALSILAEENGRQISEVGTTTFRPPFTGVTLGLFAGLNRDILQRPYRYLPTHEEQVLAGAVFGEAGQWLRPEYYPRNGETKEEAAEREMIGLRQGVALFEASPLGKILVSGQDAARFLDHFYLNNASNLKVGSVRYGAIASEQGVLLDDGVFARLAENQFLVSCSSGAAASVAAAMEEWLQCEWIDWRVSIQAVTAQYTTIAVSGPASRTLLSRICSDIDLGADAFPHMTFREGTVGGLPARVMRVSFTGEIQFEISVSAESGGVLWRTLMQAGGDLRVFPVGSEAWLRLRIEKGYIHVGTDTDGTTSPDDAGFSLWQRKTVDFIGRRSLSRPHFRRTDRLHLVGLVGSDPGVLLPVGAQVLPYSGAVPPIPSDGRVTSSCISHALGESIALALVRRGRERVGEVVSLLSADRIHTAKVVLPPFYDPEGRRLNE